MIVKDFFEERELTMNHLLKKRLAAGVLACVMTISCLTGCSSTSVEETQAQTVKESVSIETAEQTETITETAEEVLENAPVDPETVALSIDGVEVKAPELFYYYYGMKSQVEAMYQAYGIDVDYSLFVEEGLTLGDYLKLQVEVQVLNMVFLNTKSSEYPMEFTEDELETIENGLTSFFSNVDEETIALYGFTEENVRTTLENSVMSSKILDAMVDEQTERLTDEEKEACKYRTVQHILFLYEAPAETDENGATVETTAEEAESYRASQKAMAEEILARAQAGEDFETLAAEYNEDSGIEYSFNKNGQTIDGTQFVEQFVVVGNSLKEGEMAIAETEYGYHVMKCITENDEELYNSALRSAALAKLDEIYYDWVETKNPTFFDFWGDYVVINPAPLATEEETQASE